MLTSDKTITLPEYWDAVYSGNNQNAKFDSSNTARPKNYFDRFSWVAGYADGPRILGIASGHAHIEKRIKSAHKDWEVIASDQSMEAKQVANFEPYHSINAYLIPYLDKYFNTVICAQAMEYFANQDQFIQEAARVSEKLLVTVPKGEMTAWSQLRIYTENNLQELLTKYGTIEVLEIHDQLMLAKIRF